jgi:hypothetical protein
MHMLENFLGHFGLIVNLYISVPLH